MYIRWKRRPVGANRGYSGSPQNEQHLDVVLARSERVDGKPRQRVVKYLGTIRESYIDPASITNTYVQTRARFALTWFWEKVDRALGELELDDATRELLAANVAARVPRLTQEDRAALESYCRDTAAGIAPLGSRP